ncbi:hypothetical protein EJ110_NYTH06453 [Nymphaea thermarum]|nr:hypothetical protein EJ110_NYTH06453 [Nymphaea thermarum]
MGKRSGSRCRALRRLAAVEESAMASGYNLRSASGKEPAHPEEMSPGRQRETSPHRDQGNLEEMVNRLVADVATHEEALDSAAGVFQGFKEELKLMREQMADSSQERTSRVDVQRPAKYNGSRDARAIDNFLFQVDYYLDLQNVAEEDLKIKTAAMLLEGDVVAWWRRKIFDVENGHCTIQTFDDFRRELKGYFMPVDAERQTYRMVANLRQTGSLREYIRAYQKLMLDVPKMPENDKLNWFIIGLQPWAQADVERSDPKTLEQAYVAAERLADTQRRSYTEIFKPTRESDHSGKEERRDRDGSSARRQTGGRQFFRRDYSGPPREPFCWVCGEKHETKVCPKRFRPTGQANAARASEAGTSRASANALQGGESGDSSRSLPERDLTKQRAPPTKQTTERRVQKILRQKANTRGVPKKYKVKWVGEEDPTWEYAYCMWQCYPLDVKTFHNR